MEYHLSGKVSLDDYIQFNKFHQKQGFLKIINGIIYSAMILLLLGLLLLSFYVIFIEKESPLTVIKSFDPFAILTVIFLILLHTVIMPFLYKRHYKANKSLQQIQHITINEHVISIIAEDGSKMYTKSNINKILYDKDAIYIYQALNIANIIKKRFLENEDDFEALVNFVKQHFSGK
jgi:energy-coupling factor transporter transmembrane protein EcfT